MIKETGAWTPLRTPTLPTDANGWPLVDARVLVLDERVNQSYNGPDNNAVTPDIGGTYHLSFQGQADLDPDSPQNFTVQNQVYNAATNLTTADLVVPHNTYAQLLINFRNTVNPSSSTGKGVANVHLIQPGYAADTTQIFTNTMINALKPFTTLRYLNVDGANNYNASYSGDYQTYTTPSFQVGSGPHTITLQGLASASDTTVFIDNVNIVNDGVHINVNPTTANFADPGFESNQLGNGNFAYGPTGTPWTYSGGAGISANASAFTGSNPNAPEGQQVALIQGGGAISQTLTGLAASSYHISFQAMQRNGFMAESFQVLVDGNVVGTFTPPVGKLTTLEWSQRKLPSAASQISGAGASGEAWEYMVALANATHTDMSINIPGPASDDYITQLAKLIKNGDTVNGVVYAGLAPGLKVDLEYSNEVWGGIYSNFLYNYEAAQQEVNEGNTTLGQGTKDNYEVAQRYYLQRTMEATNIFRSVFGPDSSYNVIRPVLGAQEGNYSYFTSLFPWFEQNYGAPSQYFYGIGAANYAFATDFSSVDNLLASISATFPDQDTTAERFTTVANYYGLHNIAYEGGAVTSGATTDAGRQISLAASRDPRMENLISQLYSGFFAAGGETAEYYNGPFDIYTPYNQSALLELSQNSYLMASPKFRGFVDLAMATPQPVTAGYAVAASGSTPLSVTADSLGQSFTSPANNQTNDWLLNVTTAGTYNLILKSGASTTTGQVVVSVGDQNVIGTYNVGSSMTVNLGALTLHAGLNTLAITTLSGFKAISLSLVPPVITPAASLGDGGFESVQLPAGPSGYKYQPTGTAWTYSGSSGVSGNSSNFTGGNPNAPEGQQVAFIQNQGAISQTAMVTTGGNFQINLFVAHRANYNTLQTLNVTVDGVSVGKFTPTSSTYQALSTAKFNLAAGPHTITFQGLNSSGDATDFVDGVSIVPAVTTAPTFADSGFESVQLPAGHSAFTYQPTGTAWTYNGASGVAGNGSDFTSANLAAPEGQQVAFLQNQGSISQIVNNFTDGNYTIDFQLAQRANYGSSQTIQVLVDGVVISTFAATGPGYTKSKTATFAVMAGPHTVTFRGLNSSGDATAFLDDISINQV